MPDLLSAPTAPPLSPPPVQPVVGATPPPSSSSGVSSYKPPASAGAPTPSVGGELNNFLKNPIDNLKDTALLPINAAAFVLGHIPFPGNVNPSFDTIGDFMQKNDPNAYAQWLATKQEAEKDFLHGGEMKVKFTREWFTSYIDSQKDLPDLGLLKNMPGLSASGPATLGQAFADALGLLQVFGLGNQARIGADKDKRLVISHTIGSNGMPQNVYAPGVFDRVGLLMERAKYGMPMNDLEALVFKNVTSGQWSNDHALAVLVREGQGLSREPLEQIVGGLATDPLFVASLFVSAALKVGEIGKGVNATLAAARGSGATVGMISRAESISQLQKGAALLYRVQTTESRLVRASFTIGRTIVDPFSLAGKHTPTSGTVDMATATASVALRNAFGPAYESLARLATEHNFTPALRNALGNSSANFARQWALVNHALTQLNVRGGEYLFDTHPDSIVADLVRNSAADAPVRLTEYIAGIKKLFLTPEDDAQLIRRLRVTLGDDFVNRVNVASLSQDERSLLHLLSYSQTDTSFAEMLATISGYEGPVDISRLVVLNDNILDDISAQKFLAESRALAGAGTIAERKQLWKDAGGKWTAIEDLGRPADSNISIDELETKLDELIQSGNLHTRLTDEMNEPGLEPLRDWLRKNNPGDREDRLWNVGFRPADYNAFGFRRSNSTGLLQFSRTPYVGHVRNAIPAYQPAFDQATNFLGQFVGKPLAGKLTRPVEAVEVAMRTATDVVSGQRLLVNIEQRFMINMARHGVGSKTSRLLFRAAKEAAGLQNTTLQGVRSTNLWAIAKQIVVENNLPITPRMLLHELLDASGGDMRIMGLTSALSQRSRTAIEAAFGGQLNQFTGELTVNAYRLLRYTLNPVFYVQRITDAVYFSILNGVPLSGGGVIAEGSPLWEVEQISRKIGETSLARDMSFDMREFQLGSDSMTRLAARVGEIVPTKRLERLAGWGSRLQTNNMWQQTYHQFGTIVKESFDDARAAYKKLLDDPGLSDAEREVAQKAYDDVPLYDKISAHYSEEAGRTLSDKEVGLRYLQEQFGANGAQRVTKDGLLEWRHEMAEGTYQNAGTTGILTPVRQDYLAADLGYESVADMRAAIISGETSVQAIAEKMVSEYNASPAFVKRLTDVIQFNWNDFWFGARTQLGLESQELRSTLEGIVAREAQTRDMTPVEYLSQVLTMTTGETGLTGHMADLIDIVKNGLTGSAEQQSERLAAVWIRTMDPSAQRLMFDNYRRAIPGLLDSLAAEGTPEATARFAELYQQQVTLNRALHAPGGTPALARRVPMTADDYRAAYRDRSVTLRYLDAGSQRQQLRVTKSIGDGVMNLPPEQRDMLVAHLASLRERFPAVKLHTIDVDPLFHAPKSEGGLGYGLDVQGVTIEDLHGDGTAIILSPQGFGVGADAYWKTTAGREAAFTALDEVINNLPLGAGIKSTATSGPLGVLYHEFGHVVDVQIRKLRASLSPTGAGIQEYAQLVEELRNSGIGRNISAYAKTKRPGNREFVAELFDLAFNPSVNLDDIPMDVARAVERYREALSAVGLNVPVTTGDLSALPRAVSDATAKYFSATLAKRVHGVPGDVTDWVPREPLRSVPSGVYDHTVGTGGGTFDVATGKEMGLNTGYGVGMGSKGRVVDDNRKAVNAAYREVSATGSPHIGTWRKEGKVHVDPSQQIMDHDAAMALAVQRGEESIRDYAAGVDLPVPAAAAPAPIPGENLMAQDAPLPSPTTPPVPSKLREQVGNRAAGKTVKNPHPDLDAVEQAYSQWLRGHAASGFLSNRTLVGGLLEDIMTAIPTDGALMYNRSEGLVQQLFAQKIKLAQRNSFRLAEMSTQRTVASRTLNHPLFGMYPTSYMWGKVLPETIRFLAKEPFGFEGMGAGLAMYKVEQSIAAQREWDPEFDATMEKIGKSETAFALDYATPGLPWNDFRAAGPPWLNAFLRAQGFDLQKMTEAQFNTMDTRRWFRTFFDTGAEIGDALKASQNTPPPAPPNKAIQSVIDQQAPAQTPATPTGAQGQLARPLQDAFDALNALFSGQ